MREQLILELHEMTRVLHVVALPMNFNLLCDIGQQLGVLKIFLFQIFIAFWAFSLTFVVGQGFICAKYGWLEQNFPFFFLLMLLRFYISWKSFKSGNTVNTEYLNRIPNPNPKYLTGAKVPSKAMHITDFHKYLQVSMIQFSIKEN